MFSTRFTSADFQRINSASRKTRQITIMGIHQRREAAEKELPQVLDIQRRKLIIATNQTPNDAFEEFSKSKHNVIFITNFLQEQVESFRFSKMWDDRQATALVKATLIKHSVFHLNNYISCARNICEAFSNESDCFRGNSVLNIAIEYVLVHARQFGEPTKTIFQNNMQVANNQEETNQGSSITTGQQTFSQLTSKLSVMERVEQLIKELKLANDENKFMALNTHITAFTLVILRRGFKKHQDMNIHIVCLIIEAYLNTDDARTKKNLYNSCIKYMKWYDMHLPCLFQKVLDLYDIDTSVLWDHLNKLNNREVTLSLINFATVYYNNYKVLKANPAKSWFPYCSYIYTMSLSDKQNIKICTILNYLVEMKCERRVKINATYTSCITELDLKWAESSARDIYWDIYK